MLLYIRKEFIMQENNSNIRFLSCVSYIGILFVIGHFAVERNNPDLRFHTFQGGVLFCFFTIAYFCDFLLYIALFFAPELRIIIILLLTIAISIVYIMLMALGIYHAARFAQTLLPFVGRTAVTLRTRLENR